MKKPKKLKKSRFFYLHPEANAGKVAALDALQEAYTAYLKTCVEVMLSKRRFLIPLREMQSFFPPSDTLTSQIVKNARAHAVGIVSGWAASNYTTKLRRLIKLKAKAGTFGDTMRSALFILGKLLIDKPSGMVTQEALDLYWSWLLDPGIVGMAPGISIRAGMRMSEMTAVFEASEGAKLAVWWLGFSHLDGGKARVLLPLAVNPYVKAATEVSKGMLARKDKRGRWRFEFADRREWDPPEVTGEMPRLGVDVGLNVMVATSDGRLLGGKLKPKFNRDFEKIRAIRRNRQRQGIEFYKNSPRLDRRESKLTGLVRTMAGQCTNILVAKYPWHAFVVEDLDLRGCRGQKRFAYRAIHRALFGKAPTIVVNPAYTSQPCRSCEHTSRANRSGIKFNCRSCGRKGHADVFGGASLLGRSEDEQIGLEDEPSVVKAILIARYLARRNGGRDSSSGEPVTTALVPPSRKLTTGGSRK